MAVKDPDQSYDTPLLEVMASVPGLDVLATQVERLLDWGSINSLFVFPMATSCCGIELMAAAASRVDLDRMGAILRGTPRQCDVMVVAGTITVKMAPRVKRLWDQMPEPKWCVAMGSCAISGDFYRDIYSVVPGIDTFLPVDVYIPGCPPNPEQLMAGLQRLQEKVRLKRAGLPTELESRPDAKGLNNPAIRRMSDPARDPALTEAQLHASMNLGLNGNYDRSHDAPNLGGSVQDPVSWDLDDEPVDEAGCARAAEGGAAASGGTTEAVASGGGVVEAGVAGGAGAASDDLERAGAGPRETP